MSTLISKPSGDTKAGSLLLRVGVAAGTLFLALTLALTAGAGAASADVIDQCNGILDDGDGLECHVTVVNNLDVTDAANPVSSSTVTVTSCYDAAGPVLAGACDSSHLNFVSTSTFNPTGLTTEVTQCNAAANGGGSIVYCSVDILNQITGTTAAPVDATVNECTNSADGGGETLNCDGWVDVTLAPPAALNASGADIVQCDHSGNQGGSTVDCSVATDSTVAAGGVLPITVNQCNYSANLGGSIVICRTRIRTVVRATTADTSYSSNTAAFTGLPTTPVNNLAAPTQVVVPAIVVVPVTPPTPPTTNPGGSTNRTSTSSASGVSSRDRLANTGSLASTGTDPSPAGLISILVILLGVAGVVTSRRVGIRAVR